MIPHDPIRAAYEQGCKDTIDRIASELEILSDSYIEAPADHLHGASCVTVRNGHQVLACQAWDVWTWTAELAKRMRAGEMTKPLPTEPPF